MDTFLSVEMWFWSGWALLAAFILTLFGLHLRRVNYEQSSLEVEQKSLDQEITEDNDLANVTLENLFSQLPVALVQIDDKDRVVRSNLVAKSLLNIDAEEIPNFEDLTEGLGRSISGWLNQARTQSVKPEMLKAKRVHGDLYVQVNLQKMMLGAREGLLAVVSDATELKSLEAQFVQSQKMQAIGQLAGGVAHDFNNLLTAITGYCDLLLLRHSENDPSFADLKQIEQNTNRAAALVGQLLAFSRKQTLTPKALNVNETLIDLTHLLKRLVSEKITLNLEVGKNIPDAFVDGRQLEQVIMNLVVNARDAMPNGGEITIETASHSFSQSFKQDRVVVPAGEYVGIKVIDTGHGMTKEILPKIFEPFVTTKDVGEGTGLGLSTVYGIIKQTGGFIFAKSEPKKGACFQIYLPIFDAPDEDEEMAKQPPTEASTPSLSGIRIMLVEDEAPVRAVANRALVMNGSLVTEAESAEEALEILEKENFVPDIIVSDVIMPGMDGPTWVRKALEKCPGTHVIFISGYAKESFASEQSQIPNANFLPKPFSLKALTEAVQNCVKEIQNSK